MQGIADGYNQTFFNKFISTFSYFPGISSHSLNIRLSKMFGTNSA